MRYFRDYLFSLNSPSSYLFNFINSISWNLPEKIFTVLPFILGSFLFYLFSKAQGVAEWKAWFFSFIYMLNPGTVLIFDTGDAPSILMMYAIFPLVMIFGLRLVKSMNLYNVLLLAGSLILANFFFYQAFLLVWPFLLVLLFLSSNKPKLFIFLLLADLLAFLSDVNFEILIYEIVVPSLVLSHVEVIPYFTKEIFYVSFYLGIYSLALFLIKTTKESRAFVSIALLMLFVWPLVFYRLPDIPLLNAVFLAFTSFEPKFILLINGLITMSFVFIKRWHIVFALLTVILMSIADISFISLGVEEQASAYAILTFNAKPLEVSNGFYEVEKFFYDHPGFYYVGIPSSYFSLTNVTLAYELSDLIPNPVPIDNYSIHNLSAEGIKYALTLSPLIVPGLKEVYNEDGFYIYENTGFKSVAFSLSGEPLNVTVKPNQVVVYGNASEAIVLVPYNHFWTAKDYHGYLEVTMHNGVGKAVNEAYYINEYLLIIDFLTMLGVALGIVGGKKWLKI
uniref:Membrane protein 6-pyruvoyl-tetrahydropterin synthase-related domain-containing protein n=2 Tax=Acidianus TaxID=12914 RepID=A0A2U9IKZ1_9CREN